MEKQTMAEQNIERAVVSYARDNGFAVYKMDSPSQRGLPDRIFFYQGTVFFIEFKALSRKLSEMQKYQKGILEKQSFAIYVVNNIIDGKKIIKSHIIL